MSDNVIQLKKKPLSDEFDRAVANMRARRDEGFKEAHDKQRRARITDQLITALRNVNIAYLENEQIRLDIMHEAQMEADKILSWRT